jgi:hypothetical protein
MGEVQSGLMSVLRVDLDGVLRVAGSVLSSRLLVDTAGICLIGMRLKNRN